MRCEVLSVYKCFQVCVCVGGGVNFRCKERRLIHTQEAASESIMGEMKNRGTYTAELLLLLLYIYL